MEKTFNLKTPLLDIFSISYQLKKYLSKKGITQYNLAILAGTNSVQINRWIMCRQYMSRAWQNYLVELKILDPEIKAPENEREIPPNNHGQEMFLPRKKGRPMTNPVILQPLIFKKNNSEKIGQSEEIKDTQENKETIENT